MVFLYHHPQQSISLLGERVVAKLWIQKNKTRESEDNLWFYKNSESLWCIPDTNIVNQLQFFFFFCFLGLLLRHREVPSLGVNLELQLPAYTTDTAMWDLSCVCDLNHSSGQHQIPDPLSEARDRTHILITTSGIRFCWATTGTPFSFFFFFVFSELHPRRMEVPRLRVESEQQLPAYTTATAMVCICNPHRSSRQP